MSRWSRVLSVVCAVFSMVVYAETETAKVVHASAPGTMFTADEALSFTLDSTAAKFSPKWKLMSWNDRMLEQGSWPQGGAAPLVLKPRPAGYYKLVLSSDKETFTGCRTFAIVVPKSARKRNPDSIYNIDAAFSWCCRNFPKHTYCPKNTYGLMREILVRMGIGYVRERINWSKELEPQPGQYKLGPNNGYIKNGKAFAEAGIKVQNVFHDAPSFYTKKGGKLPVDMVGAYKWAKNVAQAFGSSVSMWEFWNEPDIHFAPESAWDYAAALKAANLGFHAAGKKILASNGSLADSTNLEKGYADAVFANGVGDYIDMFNVHSYSPITHYPEKMRNIHAFLAKYNLSDRPIWFTEIGTNSEGGGRIQSPFHSVKAHDEEQEMIVAEFIPKEMIIMQSLGVDKSFFFILAPLNEQNGGKDWGLTRRDYTVKPGAVALSALNNELGCAKMLGELSVDKNARVFVFEQPNGTQSLAAWTISDLETKAGQIKITKPMNMFVDIKNVKNGKYNGVSMLGTPFSVSASSDTLRLNLTRFPQYIHGLSGIVPTKPFVQRKLGRSPETVSYDRTIVFRTELSEDFKLAGSKTAANIMTDSGNGRLTLQVWNLSDTKKSGGVEIGGCKVLSIGKTAVEIAPWSKVEIPLEITVNDETNMRSTVRVTGKFNGLETSPLVMPIVMYRKAMLNVRKVPLTGMMDPLFWRHNTSGKTTFSFDEQENAVKMATVFKPKVDHWVYPEYVLQLPQESMAGALGITFEYKVSTPKPRQSLMMFVYDKKHEGGKSRNVGYPQPKDTEWHEATLIFEDNGVAAEDVKMVRIGFNPTSDDFVYWIRNVNLIFQR